MDGHLCKIVEVETNVMPVSLILFAIYLTDIFREVEMEVERCTTK